MYSTPYSCANQSFSDLAHIAAREQIYPYLFKDSSISFRDCNVALGDVEAIYDGKMAIDRIVSVQPPQFKHSLDFTVQERFRRANYAKFRDITITEWNHRTEQPSELYKMDCGLFVYGYYDNLTNTFVDWVVINCQKLKVDLVQKKLSFKHEFNMRSDQSFICLTFDSLIRSDSVLLSKSTIF